MHSFIIMRPGCHHTSNITTPFPTYHVTKKNKGPTHSFILVRDSWHRAYSQWKHYPVSNPSAVLEFQGLAQFQSLFKEFRELAPELTKRVHLKYMMTHCHVILLLNLDCVSLQICYVSNRHGDRSDQVHTAAFSGDTIRYETLLSANLFSIVEFENAVDTHQQLLSQLTENQQVLKVSEQDFREDSLS